MLELQQVHHLPQGPLSIDGVDEGIEDLLDGDGHPQPLGMGLPHI